MENCLGFGVTARDEHRVPRDVARLDAMRVLHVTDTYLPTIGGVEILVHDLATRQAADGLDVTVLTRTAGAQRRQDASGVRVVEGHAVEKELLRRANVVHAHISAYSPQAFLMSRAAAQAGVPVVVTVHSMWQGAWPIFRTIFRGGRWSSLPIQFAAVSDAAATAVRRSLGPGHHVLVLPNAIDTGSWAPAGPVRQRDHVKLVSVMRLTRRKRPQALLRVLHEVRAMTPDGLRIQADIIGDGPLREEIQRGLDHWQMTPWVRLTGELDHPQIRRLYQDADIYLAPANLESFGIAALEARTAGLAVVAKHGTGVGDFVTDGIDGYLTSSDAGMAEAVARLCGDRADLMRIIKHNREVVPPFDWSDILWRNASAYELARTRAEADRGVRRARR